MGRSEETIVADLDKTFRKDRLKEAANELEGRKRGVFGLPGVGVLVFKLVKEFGFLEFISKFSTEDNGESLDGDKEVFGGREPFFSIFGDPATWDEIMDMRVIGQIPNPGMEDSRPSDKSSDETRILSELEKSF
jgi:hypothetical protein